MGVWEWKVVWRRREGRKVRRRQVWAAEEEVVVKRGVRAVGVVKADVAEVKAATMMKGVIG